MHVRSRGIKVQTRILPEGVDQTGLIWTEVYRDDQRGHRRDDEAW